MILEFTFVPFLSYLFLFLEAFLYGYFFKKQGYPNLFKYPIISSSVCIGPPAGGYARIAHTHQVIIIGRGDPMLTRDFELRISWISWGFRNHLANPMGFVV